jgi:hypothetical protein
LEHVQTRVPENKVKVAPYFERTVRPLMQGADLIATSADEEEDEE